MAVVSPGDQRHHPKNKEAEEQFKTPPEEEDSDRWQTMMAWGDVNGGELDPKEVQKARMGELEYYNRMKAFKKASIKECLQKRGENP